ncbi:MAG: SGNH/GDSL hydrolase family protein, partial [Phycisphaeraceae bacterium]|nr:SGNH/GDSL hydrolase family protein [Phycisphaeraceae bacterium]
MMMRAQMIVVALVALWVWPLVVHAEKLTLSPNARIVLVGNGLGSRMLHYGHFESELHRRYPGHKLLIRNLCDEGNTPGYRPHSARKNPWAFPGAEKFRKLSKAKDRWRSSAYGQGHFKSPDDWLKHLKPDTIVVFFGYNESFQGPAGLKSFRAELSGYLRHILSQSYSGARPKVALVSPIAFENLSKLYGTPDGTTANANLAIYTKAMQEVAAENKVHFVNLFASTTTLFANAKTPWTRDGALLTPSGYA